MSICFFTQACSIVKIVKLKLLNYDILVKINGKSNYEIGVFKIHKYYQTRNRNLL